MRIRRLVFLAFAGAVLLSARADGPSGVAGTLHNLSRSGPGRIRALDEDRVCIFCHTSHSAKAEVPLWNRDVPTGPFVLSRSGTRETIAPVSSTPDGASRLCLSCHDGTLALGALASRREPIEMLGTDAGRMPAGSKGYLGRDLSGGHLVSFRVTPDLVARENARGLHLVPLERMQADPDVKLDANGEMQCTTCHDPHDDRNFASSGIHFYRKPDFSDVCLVCHDL